MGSWSYMDEQLEEIAEEIGFRDPRPRYAGRSTSASPAVGLMDTHRHEQAALVDAALTVGLPRLGRLQAARLETETRGKEKGRE